MIRESLNTWKRTKYQIRDVEKIDLRNPRFIRVACGYHDIPFRSGNRINSTKSRANFIHYAA